MRQIERSNHLYYDLDAPELSDYEYDALTREARALEAQYPELATATSPTQRVGGTASGKFEKVQHAVRMESLQDVFGIDEVREFDRRVRARVLRRSMWWRRRSTGCRSASSTAAGALCAALRAATATWART